jgi:hypothetical protein
VPEETATMTAEEIAQLKSQMEDLRKINSQRDGELLQAKMEAAKAKALKDFPSVDEDTLALYSGGPDGVYAFAKKLQEKFAALAPPPGTGAGVAPSIPSSAHAPVPAPGPGSHIPADQAGEIRLKELRENRQNGNMVVKGGRDYSGRTQPSDAQEYYERGLGDGLRRHFGRIKAETRG